MLYVLRNINENLIKLKQGKLLTAIKKMLIDQYIAH